MSDRLVLATKKGALIFDRKNGRWTPRAISHPGIAVSYAAADPRDGTLWGVHGQRPLGTGAHAFEGRRRHLGGRQPHRLSQGRALHRPAHSRSQSDGGGRQPVTYKPAALMKVWLRLVGDRTRVRRFGWTGQVVAREAGRSLGLEDCIEMSSRPPHARRDASPSVTARTARINAARRAGRRDTHAPSRRTSYPPRRRHSRTRRTGCLSPRSSRSRACSG